MATRKASICFVAPKAYAALSGRSDLTHIGGAEVQQVIIAHELARRGYRVSFVTLDFGQAEEIEHDGIRVYRMCAWSAGLPGLRFFHPRWTSLCAALARADADIYYQRNNGAETGQTALWCRRRRRRFVFSVSSLTNCVSSLPGMPTLRERWLYVLGLRWADLVVGQTAMQRRLLRANFGVDSVVIRSCCPDPYDGVTWTARSAPTDRPRLLWVGRAASEKRLELLFELARRCPELDFDVVGVGSNTLTHEASVRVHRGSIPNVALHGRVPHAQLADYYARASLLVCTSEVEGFPNTFLEAWARGIPVLTTLDPDGVVATSRLGLVAKTADELAQAARSLLAAPTSWNDFAQKARTHYLKYHTLSAIADVYEDEFARLQFRGEQALAYPAPPTSKGLASRAGKGDQ